MVGVSETEPAAGYRELIKGNRNFRMLWAAQIVSLLGDWFNFVASAALISQLGGSGLAVGALFVVRTLAPFLVSPWAGVVADRYDRRRVLIVTDLVRAVVVLGFLLIEDASQLWLLYLLTGIQLAASGFFYPARTAILPTVVSRRELGTANTLSAGSWSVMLALGAGLGGLFSGAYGVYPAFVLDSFTFVLSAVLVVQVRIGNQVARQAAGERKHARGGAFELYREGLVYLAIRWGVLSVVLHKALVSLFISSGFQVIHVEIAGGVFPLGESGGITLGLLFGIVGIGTGVGPLVARQITGDSSLALCRAIFVAYGIAAVGMAVTAPLNSLGWIFLGAFLRGVGGGTVWVFSSQLLYQLTPQKILGRVVATEFALFMLAGALGAMAAGWTVDSALGLSGSIWLLGGLTLTPLLLWFPRLWTPPAAE